MHTGHMQGHTEQQIVTAKPEPAATKHNRIWLLAIAAAVVLFIAAFSVLGGSHNSGADRSNAAVTACEDYVKHALKAPSTAQFSDERYTEPEAPSNVWLVTGAVDAENSFSAKLRSNFRCTMADTGERFVLQSLTGLN